MAEYDVLIIGAGQAGLACGYALRGSGLRVAIIDGAAAVGDSWRLRWDSLRLFTPARYAALPGMPFPGRPDAYPGKDQVADYLARYASTFALPVQLSTQVGHVRPDGTGGYVAALPDGEIRASQIVMATGPFGTPYVPPPARELGSGIPQLHSSEYRNPRQLANSHVLVVGGGNSGFQIAYDLTTAGRQVTLSIGRTNASVPQRILGRDIFWWQSVTGLLQVTADSWLGSRMRDADGTVIGLSSRALRHRGTNIRGRVVGATATSVEFADGRTVEPDAVVWATGFRSDFSWVRVPAAFDEHGRLQHVRGRTPAAGLYVLGLPWLHTTGSALLGFVGADATYLARQIVEQHRQKTATGRS